MSKKVVPFKKRATVESAELDAIEADLVIIEQDLQTMIGMLAIAADLLNNLPTVESLPKPLPDLEKQVKTGRTMLMQYEQALAGSDRYQLPNHLASKIFFCEKLINVAKQFLDIQEDLLTNKFKPKLRSRKPKQNSKLQFQLKITLKDSHPPIWRRVLIPGNYSLAKLHQAIQKAMGWSNSHLHHFQIAKQFYGTPDGYDTPDLLDESDFRLCDLPLKEGSRFLYEYDFGDSWIHTIRVEKITTNQIKTARCVDGKRACPPEDSGGIRHYHSIVFMLQNSHHPRHQEIREWLGEDFDPEHFSVAPNRKK
ncbi:MAG: plasmid pRiA4b ORF-3 family protein [Candidatus Obscuribacterales bacterium]|nr:plasmid pRiA4b ORF-3 family protein [Candidatus Obscuribacterales bacterium]